MSTEHRVTLAALLMFLGFLWFMCRDTMPVITVDPASLQNNVYDPFIHWRTDHPGEWFRPHPAQIGANTLPRIIQNEDRGLALEQQEVDGASYPQ